MKNLILSAFVLLLLAAPACALTPIGFGWDPMPADQTWISVRIYERSGPATAYVYTKVAEAAAPANTVDASVPSGIRTYTARSWDGMSESDDSNAITVTIKPGAPTNLHFKIP